jgi:hypothetical protein
MDNSVQVKRSETQRGVTEIRFFGLLRFEKLSAYLIISKVFSNENFYINMRIFDSPPYGVFHAFAPITE